MAASSSRNRSDARAAAGYRVDEEAFRRETGNARADRPSNTLTDGVRAARQTADRIGGELAEIADRTFGPVPSESGETNEVQRAEKESLSMELHRLCSTLEFIDLQLSRLRNI